MSSISPLGHFIRTNEKRMSCLPPKERKYAQTDLSNRGSSQSSNKIRRIGDMKDVHDHEGSFANSVSSLSNDQSSVLGHTQHIATEILPSSLGSSGSSSSNTLSTMAHRQTTSALPNTQSMPQLVFTQTVSSQNLVTVLGTEVVVSERMNEEVLHRAKAHAYNEQFPKALRILEHFKLQEANPYQKNEYYLLKVGVYICLGDYVQARDVLEGGFDVQLANPSQKNEYYLRKAKVYIGLRDYAQARDVLEGGFNVQLANPSQKNEYYLRKAEAYIGLRDYAQARDVLEGGFNVQLANTWQKAEYGLLKRVLPH